MAKTLTLTVIDNFTFESEDIGTIPIELSKFVPEGYEEVLMLSCDVSTKCDYIAYIGREDDYHVITGDLGEIKFDEYIKKTQYEEEIGIINIKDKFFDASVKGGLRETINVIRKDRSEKLVDKDGNNVTIITKVNELDKNIGDLTDLLTTEKSNLVKAINSLFDAIYPVGTEIVAKIKPTIGTWEEVKTSQGRALWLQDGKNWGDTIEQSLPNIKAWFGAYCYNLGSPSGAISSKIENYSQLSYGKEKDLNYNIFNFNANTYNNIYKDGANVQPRAICIKIWRRTA